MRRRRRSPPPLRSWSFSIHKLSPTAPHPTPLRLSPRTRPDAIHGRQHRPVEGGHGATGPRHLTRPQRALLHARGILFREQLRGHDPHHEQRVRRDGTSNPYTHTTKHPYTPPPPSRLASPRLDPPTSLRSTLPRPTSRSRLRRSRRSSLSRQGATGSSGGTWPCRLWTTTGWSSYLVRGV